MSEVRMQRREKLKEQSSNADEKKGENEKENFVRRKHQKTGRSYFVLARQPRNTAICFKNCSNGKASLAKNAMEVWKRCGNWSALSVQGVALAIVDVQESPIGT